MCICRWPVRLVLVLQHVQQLPPGVFPVLHVGGGVWWYTQYRVSVVEATQNEHREQKKWLSPAALLPTRQMYTKHQTPNTKHQTPNTKHTHINIIACLAHAMTIIDEVVWIIFEAAVAAGHVYVQ